MKKGKTGTNSNYNHDDRNITCEYYTLESEGKMCKVCSNETFCRSSRAAIVSRQRTAEWYNKKADWSNFIKEVTQPRLMPVNYSLKQSLVNLDNKSPSVPDYQKEGNILKLNWGGYYARSKVGKEKSGKRRGGFGRKSVLSKKSLKKIRSGEVPVLKMEI